MVSNTDEHTIFSPNYLVHSLTATATLPVFDSLAHIGVTWTHGRVVRYWRQRGKSQPGIKSPQGFLRNDGAGE